MLKKTTFAVLFATFLLDGWVYASDPKTEITERLMKWPQDFNSKDIQGVCGLFASDLIATYPGVTNKGYHEMCHQLTAALNDPEKIMRYEEPEIEQILIEGDLAIVRLVWTLNIAFKHKPDTQQITEIGLDVFRRQSDGSWKIAISYAYPKTK